MGLELEIIGGFGGCGMEIRLFVLSHPHPIRFVGYTYPGLKPWAMDENSLRECLCVLIMVVLVFRAMEVGRE